MPWYRLQIKQTFIKNNNYELNNLNLNIVFFQQCLKSSLINKFKNERQPLISEDEVMRMKLRYSSKYRAKKASSSSKSEGNTNKKRKCLVKYIFKVLIYAILNWKLKTNCHFYCSQHFICLYHVNNIKNFYFILSIMVF